MKSVLERDQTQNRIKNPATINHRCLLAAKLLSQQLLLFVCGRPLCFPPAMPSAITSQLKTAIYNAMGPLNGSQHPSVLSPPTKPLQAGLQDCAAPHSKLTGGNKVLRQAVLQSYSQPQRCRPLERATLNTHPPTHSSCVLWHKPQLTSQDTDEARLAGAPNLGQVKPEAQAAGHTDQGPTGSALQPCKAGRLKA